MTPDEAYEKGIDFRPGQHVRISLRNHPKWGTGVWGGTFLGWGENDTAIIAWDHPKIRDIVPAESVSKWR